MTFLDGPRYTYFGNSLEQWIVAVVTAAATLVALRLLRRAIVGRLSRTAAATPTFADDAALELTRRTRIYFFVAVAGIVGTRVLDLPDPVRHVVGRLLVLILLLQAGRWITHLIRLWVLRFSQQRALAGDAGSVTTVRALGVAAQLLFWVIVAITALETVFDYDVTALVTGLGIAGIAVALAVQNILGDLLAALAIVLDKPFVVGDHIVVGDKGGTVETIGLKTTRLRSVGGEQLIFSNAELLKSTIHNYKRMYERRATVALDVHLLTKREQLERLPAAVRAIVEAQSPVRFERAHVTAVSDRGFRIEAVYHVLDPDFNVHMDIQQRILFGMMARLEQDGIRLARTLLEEKIVAE